MTLEEANAEIDRQKAIVEHLHKHLELTQAKLDAARNRKEKPNNLDP
jgi:hypothetical protein